MKVSEEKASVDVVGGFKQSKFKIVASAKAFEILSGNIYTNRVRAVIRELSCNAYDSHVAAGVDDDFEVNLPTALDQTFSVRDYGVGLSDEEIREIFTTYFCSTKTGSNDFVGALGLGSKSPFCIVDSFNVSCYDGKKHREYSCYLDESREPQVAMLYEVDCSERRGVKVSMSIDRNLCKNFSEEAVEVFKHFDKLPAINLQEVSRLIDGELESLKKDTVISVGESVVHCSNFSGDIAIMGNIAYSIPDSIMSEDSFSILSSWSTILKFNIGELSINPGRESLTLDEKTKKALRDKLSQVCQDAGRSMLEKIESEPTSFKRWVSACNLGKRITYRQKSIREKLDKVVDQNKPKVKSGVTVFTRYYRNTVTKSNYNEIPFYTGAFYCVNSKGYHERIKKYVRDNGVTLIVLDPSDATAIDSDVILDPSTFPKVDRSSSSSAKSSSNKYCVMSVKTSVYPHSVVLNKVELRDIAKTGAIFYTPMERGNVRVTSYELKFFKHFFGSDFTLYAVNSAYRSTKAFKSSGWLDFHSAMKDFFKNNRQTITVLSEDDSHWTNRDNIKIIKTLNQKFNLGGEFEEIENLIDSFKFERNEVPLLVKDYLTINETSIINRIETLKNKFQVLKIIDEDHLDDAGLAEFIRNSINLESA